MRRDLYHITAQVPTGLFSKNSLEYSASLVGLQVEDEETTVDASILQEKLILI